MDKDFQTSFIPKKPMIEERAVKGRPIGFLNIISIFILFTVLLSTGGLYFYKQLTLKDIENMKNDLNLAKNRFEPAKITQLQTLDRRLTAGGEILSKHIALTPVFQALSAITMKTVRYTHFEYKLGDTENQKIKIILKGEAVGYESVALQSDLFTGNENLIDAVFSNLSLTQNGNVVFDLEFFVNPSFVNYKQMLQVENDTTGVEVDSALPALPAAPSFAPDPTQ